MSKINLNPVRLFTDDDIYEADVDNRPLLDLASNIELINDQLDKLGFFIEVKAGPDQEPAGGFQVNTCGYIGSNSLLYPINISKSISEIDYSKFPIVLITGYNQTLRTYKCLAFSAFYKITDRFQAFLPTSIGNQLKVGPGGQLIDEFFFNQYYVGKGYQHLIVGKISSVKEIAFGGNQINVFGDSSFLSKNHDDSTSGLITVSRSNKDSNVVFKSVGIDSVNSPYLFSEIQCSFKPEFISSASIPTPVFFTHSNINYNQLTGTILDADIDSKLNELHFKSPEISINTSSDKVYESLGVTVNSLLKFSSSNLLHSSVYSSASSEFNQNICTNLNFGFANSNQTQLVTSFPSIKKSVGNILNQESGLPDELLPTTEPVSGLVFGNYLSSNFGAIIESITDNALLSSGRQSAQAETDLQLVKQFTTLKLSSQENGNTLLIHAKSDTATGLTSSIAIVSDSHIVLSAKTGVHVNKTPELDSEVVNKGYLTKVLSDVTEISNKIPLTGTDTANPITGKLTVDLTKSGATTLLNITSNSTTDIASNTILRILEVPDTNNLQRILFKTEDTIDPNNSLWNGSEGVNKDFLKTYVEEAVIPDSSSYVTKSTDQDIDGIKNFTNDILLDSGLVFTKATTPTIQVLSGKLDFDSKLTVDTPSTDNLIDSIRTVVNKEYVDIVKLDTINRVKNVWANWSQSPSITTGMLANNAPTSKSADWDSYVSTGGNAFTILQDCVMNFNLSVNLRLTEYIISANLVRFPGGNLSSSEVIASASTGTSTSAAGFVTGNYQMSINTQVLCESGDVLKFIIVSQTPTKSTGSLLDASNYGFINIIRL